MHHTAGPPFDAGAADVRTGGTWSLAQRAKNDVLWALACLLLTATRPLPLPALRALGRSLGRAAYLLVPSARRTALANVASALPSLCARERRALVRRCFRTLGELLGETVTLLRAGGNLPPLPLAQGARALFDDCRKETRGIVFASAHLGPWERVAASLVAAGLPLVTLARESYDPRFSRLYNRLRASHGVGVIWRASPGAAARILRTLRAGGVLGVPMDLRSRVPCCQTPFLGRDAPTPIGPARIALRSGAAVVVGTVAPDARGGLEITATRIDTGDLAPDAAGALVLTARINAELSERILALPHAWVWMHERWPHGNRAMMGG